MGDWSKRLHELASGSLAQFIDGLRAHVKLVDDAFGKTKSVRAARHEIQTLRAAGRMLYPGHEASQTERYSWLDFYVARAKGDAERIAYTLDRIPEVAVAKDRGSGKEIYTPTNEVRSIMRLSNPVGIYPLSEEEKTWYARTNAALEEGENPVTGKPWNVVGFDTSVPGYGIADWEDEVEGKELVRIYPEFLERMLLRKIAVSKYLHERFRHQASQIYPYFEKTWDSVQRLGDAREGAREVVENWAQEHYEDTMEYGCPQDDSWLGQVLVDLRTLTDEDYAAKCAAQPKELARLIATRDIEGQLAFRQYASDEVVISRARKDPAFLESRCREIDFDRMAWKTSPEHCRRDMVSHTPLAFTDGFIREEFEPRYVREMGYERALSRPRRHGLGRDMRMFDRVREGEKAGLEESIVSEAEQITGRIILPRTVGAVVEDMNLYRESYKVERN